MTINEFKKQVAEDVRQVLDVIDDSDLIETLDPNPSLEDWYSLFFTVWNDNIGDIVVET